MIVEGDVVVLKSGGPAMTVIEISEDQIWCEWFDANNKITLHSFNEHSLIVQNKHKSD